MKKLLPIYILIFSLFGSQALFSPISLASTPDACFLLNQLDLIQTNQTYNAFVANAEPLLANQLIPNDTTCLKIEGDRHSGNQTTLAKAALQMASERNITLFIEGNLFLSAPITLFSNTDLVGINDAKIISYQKTLTNLLYIESGAKNVSISDLTLKEARPVTVALVLLRGKNQNIYFNNTNFLGAGADSSEATRGILLSRDWAENVRIDQSYFSDLEFGFQAVAPIKNLTIKNSEFTRWTDMAIYLNRSRVISLNHRTENINILGNYMHNASFGNAAKQAIVISRGPSRYYVKDVKISQNQIVGNGGAAKLGVPSSAHGDQIVLFGVNQFLITQNEISLGGENGVTTSGLSRNGLISNNDIHNNDGHGMSIGSGVYEIVVDDVSQLNVGDLIGGQISGASAEIAAVFTESNSLLLKRTRGQAFRVEPINNLSRNISAAANVSITDRTKRIRIINNRIYDNGLNTASEVFPMALAGIFIVNADSIELRRNEFYNSTATRTQYLGVSATKSRNIFINDSNIMEGLPLDNTTQPDIKVSSTAWLSDRVYWDISQ